MSRPEDPDEFPSSEEHDYFCSIEEQFIRLRGAPMMLSNADWQVARKWFERGIPLTLVRATLEDLFARRRMRGASAKVLNLRYCAGAVENAWIEVKSLSAPRTLSKSQPLDVAARLSRLAAALPPELDDLPAWRRRIVQLGEDDAEQSPERVETDLGRLDAELVSRLFAAMPQEKLERLQAAVDRSLVSLMRQTRSADLELARKRLLAQRLRQEQGLPVLSLFSSEAVAGAGGAKD